jgi:hypothetical protein
MLKTDLSGPAAMIHSFSERSFPQSPSAVMSIKNKDLQQQTTLGETGEFSMTDWLRTLEFRKGTPPGIAAAAHQTDADRLARELRKAWGKWCRLGERKRETLFRCLAEIWPVEAEQPVTALDTASLAHCLFAADLSADELSGRVETILAGCADGKPDFSMLLSAIWLLRLSWNRLEPQTLLSLWRWTLDAGKEFPCAADDSGKPGWDQIEIAILHGQLFDWLRGGRKRLRQSLRFLKTLMDETTDDDGTPHARDLGKALPRLCQLGRIKLFFESFGETAWKAKLQTRIEGMYHRIASLWTPDRFLFSDLPADVAARQLTGVAIAFRGEEISETQKGRRAHRSVPLLPAIKRSGKIKLPGECHQSDWASWGCLRSGWTSPVDACVIRFAGDVPELELIAADQPVFAGAWSHEVSIDGHQIPAVGEWSCCCWFVDHQAAYLELQLSHEKVQVIRQALLLREDSVLLIGDSVRAPGANQIQYQRSLPLSGNWLPEQDSATRELALVQASDRVRIFPLSAPQVRLEGARETTGFQNGKMTTTAQTTGHGLFIATMLDWSEKRKEDPVDWQRLTVAEDGTILPPQMAAGCRIRLGRKQWIMYHSLQQGQIPRTVMGLHSASETVFARLDSDGDLLPIVEVEL